MELREIPSPCLEEAAQIIAAHTAAEEYSERAMEEELRGLAGRYGLDAEDMLDAIALVALDIDGSSDVAGDAQERTPHTGTTVEFSHGGERYRIVATENHYPDFFQFIPRSGSWEEVDPAQDLALYDAFIAHADSIHALDPAEDRPTLRRLRVEDEAEWEGEYITSALSVSWDPMDPDVGGGP